MSIYIPNFSSKKIIFTYIIKFKNEERNDLRYE